MSNITCILILIVIILVITNFENFENFENFDKYSSITQIDSTINLLHINNLLTSDECDYMINLSKRHFINSQVISTDGTLQFDDARTSQSYFVDESDLVANKIKNKINVFLSENIDSQKKWNDYIENIQMVKYEIGQQYKSHYDYFTHDYSNQRNYTIFIYLNDITNGGETYFPKLNKKIKPTKGSALFWKNCVETNKCFDESLHQGLPPLDSVKYGMNVWIRFNKVY
jgi:prolyl 4-hydroxylase